MLPGMDGFLVRIWQPAIARDGDDAPVLRGSVQHLATRQTSMFRNAEELVALLQQHTTGLEVGSGPGAGSESGPRGGPRGDPGTAGGPRSGHDRDPPAAPGRRVLAKRLGVPVGAP